MAPGLKASGYLWNLVCTSSLPSSSCSSLAGIFETLLSQGSSSVQNGQPFSEITPTNDPEALAQSSAWSQRHWQFGMETGRQMPYMCPESGLHYNQISVRKNCPQNSLDPGCMLVQLHRGEAALCYTAFIPPLGALSFHPC